ncbi:hypothetical protein D1872_339000 [compost metagenome]
MDRSKHNRWKEAAKTTHHGHDSVHDACLLVEDHRYELEDDTIACACTDSDNDAAY